MLKTHSLHCFALILAIGQFPFSNSKAVGAVADLSAEQWREDLNFMINQMTEIHDNLYHTINRESFDSAVSAIDRDIPNLSSNQIIVRFAELVSAVGDGHTALRVHRGKVEGYGQFPFDIYFFKDGWFIRGAMPGNERTVGAKIISIDGVAIDEVFERVSVIIPRDNEWTIRSNAPAYMIIPKLLNGLGIIDDASKSTITLVDQSGVEFKLTPEIVTSDQYRAVRNSDDFLWAFKKADQPITLWLRNPQKDFWREYLEESNSLYVQYNRITNGRNESFAEFTQKMFAVVDKLSVDKLIIDLRMNGGGNNFLNKPLIHGIIARPEINQEGKLFVITSRNTFSAASHLVTYLESHTNALFVGEPMGGSPNHYGDARTVKLPNSGLSAKFSTVYWQNSTPFERRKVHGPDLSIQQTSTQFINNFDPALDAILQYESQATLAERLTEMISSGAGGYERARQELFSFIQDPIHEYVSAESKLNTLGYELFGKGEIDYAVAIFKLNTEAYPEKANTWDSYAEALAAIGDSSAAILNYEKSLELNPQNSNAKRMIAQLNRE